MTSELPHAPWLLGGESLLALASVKEFMLVNNAVIMMVILLVLFFPKGILGTIRQRWARWLP